MFVKLEFSVDERFTDESLVVDPDTGVTPHLGLQRNQAGGAHALLALLLALLAQHLFLLFLRFFMFNAAVVSSHSTTTFLLR